MRPDWRHVLVLALLCACIARRQLASVEQPEARFDYCRELFALSGYEESLGFDVSWPRLLCETVDLDRFTRAPRVPYVARLASSHDRASVAADQSGWFGNEDLGMYLRDQGDEHVMMEAEKPGVITRIWSPAPSGRLRIYIDDREKPAMDVDMLEFFSGKLDVPWGAPLVTYAAQGYSAYFPVPYARYARVATTTSARLYYQINYRVYASDVKVEAFSPAGLTRLTPVVRALQHVLSDPEGGGPLPELRTQILTLTDAGPSSAADIGPAVVRVLTLKGFQTQEEWLRQTRLIVSVDGERTVDAPIGDLFSAAQGLQNHASLAASVSSDALTLRWPMPVQRRLELEVQGNACRIGNLTFELRYSVGLPEQHRLFHARWTGVHTFDTAKPAEWTLLHARGPGWYVGTVLSVTNPVANWWGEGDEKIFVDGAPEPSHFGTGTEDYFGYGWCSNQLFSSPWAGQTRADGPSNWGRSSLYRWHVSDAVPFDSDLRFQLEVLHLLEHDASSTSLSQDAVAYWYAAPGTSASDPLVTSAFRLAPLTADAPLLPRGPYTCKP